jgi:vancomycin permeability regulator SanA
MLSETSGTVQKWFPPSWPVGRGWLLLRRIAVALAAAYLLAAAVVVGYGLDDEVAVADLVVVPGNTVAPDGTPSPRLRARLDVAVRVYRQGAAPVIMVSGGRGAEGFDEAASMAAYLRRQGVPDTAIVQDATGIDTAATADHVAEYLRTHGLRSAIVATQYFHVARTDLLLRRRGVRVIGTVHARLAEPRDAYSVLREVPAIAVAAFTG